MLYRLIYVSLARQSLPLDLKDILRSSRNNNPRVGVTGALCLLDGVDLQCLEGEGSVIAELYQFIAKDPRHRSPRVLLLERAEKRLFEGWSMALMTWADETRGIFEFFHPGDELNLYRVSPSKARLLIESFAASRNWAEV